MSKDASTAGLLRVGFLSAGALIGAGVTLRMMGNKPRRVASSSVQAEAPVKPVVEKPVEGQAAEPQEPTSTKKLVKLDGIGAVEYISYQLSDLSFIVVPAANPVNRCVGDESLLLIEGDKVNSFGQVGESLVTHIPQGHSSALAQSLKEGKLVSVLVGSSSLLSMIPSMYQFANQGLPVVFHVVPGAVDIDCSFKMNFQDALATRQTGVSFLCSQSVQEAQDLALIAHVAASRTSSPFLHVFDTAYNGSQESTLVDQAQLSSIAKGLRVSTEKDDSAEASDEEYSRTGKRSTDHLPSVVESVMQELAFALGHKYSAFEYTGPADAEYVIVSMGSSVVTSRPKVGVLKVRLFRPWSEELFLAAMPESVKRVAVVDHSFEDDGELGPLYLDVIASVQKRKSRPLVVSSRFSGNSVSEGMVNSIVGNITSQAPSQKVLLVNESTGSVPVAQPSQTDFLLTPETTYTKMLQQSLGDNVVVSNASGSDSVWGSQSAGYQQDSFGDVEFGYGVLLAMMQRRKAVVNAVSEAVTDPDMLGPDLNSALSDWLLYREDTKASNKLACTIDELLDKHPEADESVSLQVINRNRHLLRKSSQWLVGGSNWAYDLTLSGIHHVIASKENINVLIVDSENYSTSKRDPSKWKKDIGLYAMNYGGVYVASVAVYASYTQVLQALKEADAYPGPSVVLAYAPQTATATDMNSATLHMLKETKLAVDNGKWPLYRWNPADEKSFCLDSQYIQQQLKQFLKRDNHLSLMAKEVPKVSQALSSSLNTNLETQHKGLQKKAVDSYVSLLKGLSNSQPVLFTYASDGGNATAVAERLCSEANARGLDGKCIVMDDVSVADLVEEKNVVFVVSTAGQGEMPMNGKAFWTNLINDSGPGMLTDTKFAVFAMGDRHYWPRPEEAIYFCKPGVDLDAKILEIGGQRLVEAIGLGDDQDDDGYNTALGLWEPQLWTALGVDGVAGNAPEKPFNDDQMKIESNYLRGTILEGLADESTGAIDPIDCKLTKFHGIYQQDDRDLRESRRQQGLEKAYSFMIRVRVPGGSATPAQYLAMDELGSRTGNGTLKLTTRQAFQLHGVIKKNLKPTIADINHTLMDTLAACGDVCRNVMACANPINDVGVYNTIQKFARDLSAHLSPRTSAYHEIWLDKKQVAGHVDVEPLYGETYLPRKFKVSIAVPPHNDVDCYAHCLNYVAIVKDEKVTGFNVLVGGGMGMTHNNKKTYPCTASVMGFCTVEQAVKVGEAVMLTQRDNGERVNRKHARMKYTLEDMGMEAFRASVEKFAGFPLEEAKPFEFVTNNDRLGWTQSSDKMWHYGLFIENGRIKDRPDYPLKTALKAIAMQHTGDFRLTGNANMYIGNCDDLTKKMVQGMLDKYGVGNKRHTGLRRSAMACASLPYCALAFAESERYLPTLIGKLEDLMEAAGIRDDSIVMRMTGCANGCARPYVAEIGLVGRAPGVYNLYIGAGHAGQRLSKLYKESVNEEQVITHLTPLLQQYAKERSQGEFFGDFVIRKGHIKATEKGPDFHANLVNTLD